MRPLPQPRLLLAAEGAQAVLHVAGLPVQEVQPDRRAAAGDGRPGETRGGGAVPAASAAPRRAAGPGGAGPGPAGERAARRAGAGRVEPAAALPDGSRRSGAVRCLFARGVLDAEVGLLHLCAPSGSRTHPAVLVKHLTVLLL